MRDAAIAEAMALTTTAVTAASATPPERSMLALLSAAGQPALPTPLNLIQSCRWAPTPAGPTNVIVLDSATYIAFQHYASLTSGDEEAALLSYLNPERLRQFYRSRGVKKCEPIRWRPSEALGAKSL